ncbi:MAG: sensor histidine kinase, partial [Armatimonadota bacterium]
AISDVPGGERVVVGELPMGVEVVGDGNELVRLVANLLSNALRCTPEEGTITLETGLLGDRAFLRVRDSGCGIPSEHLPRLGERFHRIEAARSRAEGGTGLGLAIIREIAARHGGALEFESEVGVGTQATVLLPAARTAKA